MKIVTRNVYKHKKSVVLYLFVFLLLIWLFINSVFGPVDAKNKENKNVIIAAGSSTSKIADTLLEEKLINSSFFYRLYIRVNSFDGKLKAGDYELSPSMSMKEITDNLLKGQIKSVSFTIPEGYTLDQIAEVLISKGLVDEKEFWRVVKEESFSEFDFLKDLPKGEKRLEGYLFPDTYKISKGTSEKQIVSMMLKRFEDIYKGLPENKSGLALKDMITLASVVEKEAKVAEERPIIAAVFLNRLKENMVLQSCATVQYVLPERKEKILNIDTEIDSPYNTYKNIGLPPGPIGNPGKASLSAVCQPKDTNYLYFVANPDGSGRHLFATTFEGHKKNRRKLGV